MLNVEKKKIQQRLKKEEFRRAFLRFPFLNVKFVICFVFVVNRRKEKKIKKRIRRKKLKHFASDASVGLNFFVRKRRWKK